MSSSTRRTPLGVKCLAVGRTFDRVLVAIYSDGSASQLQAVIARILCNTDAIDQHPRLTVTDRHVGTVHYDTERGFVFFCVTDESYPQRAAFKCIAAVRSDFLRQFGDIAEKSAYVHTNGVEPLSTCVRLSGCLCQGGRAFECCSRLDGRYLLHFR